MTENGWKLNDSREINIFGGPYLEKLPEILAKTSKRLVQFDPRITSAFVQRRINIFCNSITHDRDREEPSTAKAMFLVEYRAKAHIIIMLVLSSRNASLRSAHRLRILLNIFHFSVLANYQMWDIVRGHMFYIAPSLKDNFRKYRAVVSGVKKDKER